MAHQHGSHDCSGIAAHALMPNGAILASKHAVGLGSPGHPPLPEHSFHFVCDGGSVLGQTITV